jgi:hypothetical protein
MPQRPHSSRILISFTPLSGPSRPGTTPRYQDRVMLDIGMLAIGLAGFAVMVLYLQLCDRL